MAVTTKGAVRPLSPSGVWGHATRSLRKVLLEILVPTLVTDFQDLVAKVKNLVALVPVIGAILRPVL